MKTIVGLIFLLFLNMTSVSGQWNRTLVGTAPNVLNLIRVGDGRNDGVQRVYAICEDANVYEWTYTGTGWTRVSLGAMPGSGWCLGIDIGKGKNDGLNRVYATRIDGNIHEYFYNGTQWVRTSLGNPNSTIYGVCVGTGRNDGINRVYASGDGVPPVEYAWSGSVWLKDTVESANLQQWLPTVGPGRNDGVQRLYLPNSMGSVRTVAEYTWNGTAFVRNDLPSVTGNPLSIAIGAGRNDVINRIYCSSRTKVYEFTYQSGTWQVVDILPGYNDEARYNITTGKTKIDGKNRVYVSCSGTQFIEISWSGTAWVDTVIDAVSAATCGIAIGRGRNDDTVRIYGCNRNGEVWEFTHDQPYVAIEEETDFLLPPLKEVISLLPNPCRNHLSIEYRIANNANVRLSVYDLQGKEVRCLLNEVMNSGFHTAEWDCLDGYGRRLSPGMYFIMLDADKQVSKKCVILGR